MSIASEITRLQNAKTAISTAISSKGVTVPSGTKLDGFAALIAQISGAPSGLNEVAYGTFTPTTATPQVTITHGMSGNPTGYFIWRTNASKQGYINQMFFPAAQMSDYSGFVYNTTYGSGSQNVYGNGTITVSSGGRNFNTQEYHWIMWR